MSTPFRNKALRRTALESLTRTCGMPLADEVLRKHVGDLERPQPTDDEWQVHTKWLEENGHIIRIDAAFDPELVQWAITEKGRTLLKTF